MMMQSIWFNRTIVRIINHKYTSFHSWRISNRINRYIVLQWSWHKITTSLQGTTCRKIPFSLLHSAKLPICICCQLFTVSSARKENFIWIPSSHHKITRLLNLTSTSTQIFRDWGSRNVRRLLPVRSLQRTTLLCVSERSWKTLIWNFWKKIFSQSNNF